MKVEVINKTKTRILVKDIMTVAIVLARRLHIDKNKTVSVGFVGERRIRTLNRQYRNHDQVTDILSFQDDSSEFLGELILCYPQIKRQAKQQRTGINQELVFIFVHGILHLLGYEDETARGHNKMMRLGEELCKSALGTKW